MVNKPGLFVGGFAGLIVFLVYVGYDITPVLFLAAIAGLVVYANPARTTAQFLRIIQNTKDDDTNLANFNDIGGQDTAKNELREALNFINSREKIKELGIRPLKGILLSGPPGTGKTLLAKAAANYTNSIFLAVSGSEFVEMYVGVGAKRVRQLFFQAYDLAKREKKASAVIFIDEIDVLGAKRGSGNGSTEHDQTLNELLVQMDGLKSDNQIQLLVIAATNRIDLLDSALLRPGRFDRQVQVGLPDKKGRLGILKIHARNKPLALDVSLETIAENTFGFSGAQLESLMNEAAIVAFREGSTKIMQQQVRQAIDKVILGEKLDRVPNANEKLRIAVHEAGHAVVSEYFQPGSVAEVHVGSRSNALGYVRQQQKEDMYLYTLPFLQQKIAVALAGFSAEKQCLGNSSTGASNDFKQAAELAKQIVYSGMSNLGVISPTDLPQERLHEEISRILGQQEQNVCVLLSEKKQMIYELADILVKNEYISGGELREYLSKVA